MQYYISCNTATALEVLADWWQMVSLYGVVLGVGIVRVVRQPTAPTFSLSKRAGRGGRGGAGDI